VLRHRLSLFKDEQVTVAAIFWTCIREVAGSILDRNIGQSCNGDGASGTQATDTVNLVTIHKSINKGKCKVIPLQARCGPEGG